MPVVVADLFLVLCAVPGSCLPACPSHGSGSFSDYDTSGILPVKAINIFLCDRIKKLGVHQKNLLFWYSCKLTNNQRIMNSNTQKNAPAGAVYGLGFIGAAIFFISNAAGFWIGVLGFLKAIIWPAFLVYHAFDKLLM